MNKKRESQNLIYIKIFLVVLAFAAFISIAYKFFLLVQNSTFKHDSFNLLLVSDNVSLYHLDRRKNELLIKDLGGKAEAIKNKNKISTSLALGVPLDGKIVIEDGQGRLSVREIFPLLFTPGKYDLDGLNELDIIKFLILSSITAENKSSLDYFRDAEIINEKISIEIINSTEIDGLGGTILEMLKGAGYNVISVSTEQGQKSQITARKKGVSVQKLTKLFGLPVIEVSDSGIADVSIILGKDFIKNLN